MRGNSENAAEIPFVVLPSGERRVVEQEIRDLPILYLRKLIMERPDVVHVEILTGKDLEAMEVQDAE